MVKKNNVHNQLKRRLLIKYKELLYDVACILKQWIKVSFTKRNCQLGCW